MGCLLTCTALDLLKVQRLQGLGAEGCQHATKGSVQVQIVPVAELQLVAQQQEVGALNKRQVLPDHVPAIACHPEDGGLSLKGDKAKATMLSSVHSVPWHVHVHDIPASTSSVQETWQTLVHDNNASHNTISRSSPEGRARNESWGA